MLVEDRTTAPSSLYYVDWVVVCAITDLTLETRDGHHRIIEHPNECNVRRDRDNLEHGAFSQIPARLWGWSVWP